MFLTFGRLLAILLINSTIGIKLFTGHFFVEKVVNVPAMYNNNIVSLPTKEWLFFIARSLWGLIEAYKNIYDQLRKNYKHCEYRLHRQCYYSFFAICLIILCTTAYIYACSFVVDVCALCAVCSSANLCNCVYRFLRLYPWSRLFSVGRMPQHTAHKSKCRWKVSWRTLETYLETKSSGRGLWDQWYRYTSVLEPGGGGGTGAAVFVVKKVDIVFDFIFFIFKKCFYVFLIVNFFFLNKKAVTKEFHYMFTDVLFRAPQWHFVCTCTQVFQSKYFCTHIYSYICSNWFIHSDSKAYP